MPLLTYDLQGLNNLSKKLQNSLTARLATGVQAQTRAVQQAWLNRVQEAGERKFKVYEEALQKPDVIEYPVDGDKLHGRVIIRDNPRVRRLELGGPSWDMKNGLLSGPKSRPMKNGGRYNIIPLGMNEDLWFKGVNYRTVSTRSKPGSWIYPAQEGRHFIPEVEHEMQPQVARALAQEVKAWQR